MKKGRGRQKNNLQALEKAANCYLEHKFMSYIYFLNFPKKELFSSFQTTWGRLSLL